VASLGTYSLYTWFSGTRMLYIARYIEDFFVSMWTSRLLRSRPGAPYYEKYRTRFVLVFSGQSGTTSFVQLS
jgi:hypothetical protein